MVVANNMAYEWGWYQPPLPMSASQSQKMTALLMSAASREISNATLQHEIIRVRLYANYPGGSKLKIIWSIPATGETVFEWNDTAPSTGWIWYQAWIGHLPNKEIYKAGTYKCEFFINNNSQGSVTFKITAPTLENLGTIKGYMKDVTTNERLENALITFSGKTARTASDGSYSIYQAPNTTSKIIAKKSGYKDASQTITIDMHAGETYTVSFWMTPEVVEPPEETWLEKLIRIAKETILKLIIPKPTIIDKIYLLATGKPLTEEEFLKLKMSQADFLLNLDVYSRLFTGKNLAGEEEAFGKTGDYITMAIDTVSLGLFFLTPGIPDEVAVKVGGKGLITMAEKLRLKSASPLEIERYLAAGKYKYLLAYAREQPRIFAKFLAELSTDVKSLILKGLKEQADPTAFNLAVKAIANVEGAKGLSIFHRIIPGAEHPYKTAAKVVIVMGSALGIDVWGNWAIIDNLSFTLNMEARAVRDQFNAGEITKEEALTELDRIIALSELGAKKVRVSALLNPIQILFLPLWDEIAEENTKLLETIRTEIEGIEPPAKTGLLVIRPTPADAEVFVEGQYKTTGVWSAEIPIGSYAWNVTKFGYTSKSGTIELTEEGLEFSVEIEKEVVPPEELVGDLTISVSPDETNIFISGHPEITREGTYTLPLGPYTIYFSLEGYRDHTKYATLKAGIPVTVSHSMIKEEEPEPEKAELLITSKPSFASVMIDGRSTYQKTPYTAFLDEGMHTIRVELSDYEPEEEDVDLVWGDKKTTEFILNKTPPTKGTLRILSDPPGAHVYIDGESKFASTPYTITLLADSYKIRLTKDGYLSDEADVIVEAGVEMEHKVELEKKPITDARITITSSPIDADIYIDGEYQYAKTPFTKLLKPVTYTIRVQKDGYYPETAALEFEEGEESTVTFTLTEIPAPEIPPEPYTPYVPYYPDYVPAEPYVPSFVTTPPAEIPPLDYSLLYPETFVPTIYEPAAPPIEKELLVNIETTDSKPWKGRIYSIAIQDLSAPETGPVVLVNDNEEELIREFLSGFESRDFKRLIGFKLTFDHRFIFNKIMNYRLQSEKWANIEMRDVKQLMDQVQEEFVYFPDKTGTLDDYGKSLLGKGKYGAQKEILKQFLAGNYDYVKAFQERQLEITNGLYQLFRFSASGSFSAPEQSPVPGVLIPETPLTLESEIPLPKKICKECMQENPIENTVCLVCGASL